MRRAFRVSLGIALALTMAVFSGFALGGGKALAGGAAVSARQLAKQLPSQAPSPSKRYTPHVKAPSRITNTASTDQWIVDDTAVKKGTSRTYSKNVCLDGYCILYIAGNVVINGDFWAFGDVYIYGGGKLTVNGDLNIGGLFSISDNAQVIVNKAPAWQNTIDDDAGGDVAVTTLHDDFYDQDFSGLLYLTGSAKLTINYSYENHGLSVDSPLSMSMDSPNAKITVYNSVYFVGGSTAGYLTAGTIEVVNGDFIQSDYNAADSFCPSPDFKVILRGIDKTKREVHFRTPYASFFSNLTLSNITLTGPGDDYPSYIPLHRDLVNDETLSYPGCNLIFTGNITGKTLSIDADSVWLPDNGSVTLGGGTLNVNGNLGVDTGASLSMTDDADKVTVNGAFLSASAGLTLQKGCLEVHGDFMQFGTAHSCPPESYKPNSGFVTKILGSGRYVHFDDPLQSFFTKFVFDAPQTFDSDSVVSIRSDLDANLTLPCALVYGGSLGENTLTAQNNVTIPANQTLTVGDSLGGGILYVSGSLTVQGNLVMKHHDDLVTVGGDFTASNPYGSSAGNLTDGRLQIGGSFTQSGDPGSFIATNEHQTIFVGSGASTITFNGASSKFANLAVMNTNQTMTDSVNALPTTRYAHILKSTEVSTKLGNFTTGSGTVTPAFSANTSTYTLYMPKGSTRVDMVFTPQYPDHAIMQWHINMGSGFGPGNPIFDNKLNIGLLPNKNFLYAIDVLAVNDDYNDAAHCLAMQRYVITAEVLSADLASLGLPEGMAADKAFAADTYAYTVDLPATSAPFTWAPTTVNPDTPLVIKLDGTSLGKSTTVAVSPGGTAVYTVNTTAQDGTDPKTYTVTFRRANPVANIIASPAALAPAFSAATASYTVTLPSTAPTATIAVQRSATCSGIKFNGAEQPNDTLYVAVDPGCTVPVTIACTDTVTSLVTTYTVNVTRVAMVTGIAASTGSLDKAFSPDTANYTLTIPATSSSVKITPTKASTGVKDIYIDDKKATYKTVYPKIGETLSQPVKITALASDGKTWSNEYKVTVTRTPLVTNIHVSAGTLTFSPTTLAYTVFIPADTDHVTVSADTATVKSCIVAKPTLSPALNSSDSTTVTAIGTDGKTKITYTVTVKRVIVTGITVTGGTLSPAFDPAATADRRTYSVNVPATTASVTLTPETTADCTSLKINGVEQASLTVPLAIGQTIPVTVSGSTVGGATSSYKINVTRAPLVTSIATNNKAYPLGFSAATTTYNLSLSPTVSSITLTAAKSKTGVKAMALAVNGAAVKGMSTTVKPRIGETVKVEVTALATDGTTGIKYTVNVTRQMLISDIQVSSPDCTPMLAFNPATTNYTVDIPADGHSVTVTPVPVPGNVSIMTVDGAQRPFVSLIPGVCGSKTTAIVATGSDGKTKATYTVTVRRAAVITGITVTTDAAGTVGMTPAFNPTTLSYTVNVPATATTVTITPAKGTDCTSLGIDGTASNSLTLGAPDVGSTSWPKVPITASTAGGTDVSYNVTIQKPALITKISSSIAAYPVTPAFTPGQDRYAINLPATVSSVTISVTKAAIGVKSVTVNGKAALSNVIKVDAGASVDVAVVVTGTDGMQCPYVVKVSRAIAVTNLTASAGTMSQAFDPATTNYTVDLPADTSSVTLTPTVTATYTCINDVTGTTGAATVTPKPGETKTVKFTVTGGLVYTVTVHRADALTRINVNGKDLDLTAGKTDYGVNVPANIENATITPTVADGCSFQITGEDDLATSVVISPAIGDTATAEIVVTAGSDHITYKVTVNRDAALGSLGVNVGDTILIHPEDFVWNTYTYTTEDIPYDSSTENPPVITILATGAGNTQIEFKQDNGTYALGKAVVSGFSCFSFEVSKPEDANQSIVTIRCTPAYTQTEILYTVTINWVDTKKAPTTGA